MILAEQTFLMNLGERPPNTFDVLIGHGPISLVKINPEAHPFCHLRESINMSLY